MPIAAAYDGELLAALSTSVQAILQDCKSTIPTHSQLLALASLPVEVRYEALRRRFHGECPETVLQYLLASSTALPSDRRTIHAGARRTGTSGMLKSPTTSVDAQIAPAVPSAAADVDEENQRPATAASIDFGHLARRRTTSTHSSNHHRHHPHAPTDSMASQHLALVPDSQFVEGNTATPVRPVPPPRQCETSIRSFVSVSSFSSEGADDLGVGAGAKCACMTPSQLSSVTLLSTPPKVLRSPHQRHQFGGTSHHHHHSAAEEVDYRLVPRTVIQHSIQPHCSGETSCAMRSVSPAVQPPPNAQMIVSYVDDMPKSSILSLPTQSSEVVPPLTDENMTSPQRETVTTPIAATTTPALFHVPTLDLKGVHRSTPIIHTPPGLVRERLRKEGNGGYSNSLPHTLRSAGNCSKTPAGRTATSKRVPSNTPRSARVTVSASVDDVNRRAPRCPAASHSQLAGGSAKKVAGSVNEALRTRPQTYGSSAAWNVTYGIYVTHPNKLREHVAVSTAATTTSKKLLDAMPSHGTSETSHGRLRMATHEHTMSTGMRTDREDPDTAAVTSRAVAGPRRSRRAHTKGGTYTRSATAPHTIRVDATEKQPLSARLVRYDSAFGYAQYHPMTLTAAEALRRLEMCRQHANTEAAMFARTASRLLQPDKTRKAYAYQTRNSAAMTARPVWRGAHSATVSCPREGVIG